MHSTTGLRRWHGLMTIELPEPGCTTGGCRCFPLGSLVDEAMSGQVRVKEGPFVKLDVAFGSLFGGVHTRRFTNTRVLLQLSPPQLTHRALSFDR